jgi:hypothetical protein
MPWKTEMKTAGDAGRASGRSRWLRPGTAAHLGQTPGELTVLAGRAWLTRSNDASDYFLVAGEHVLLERSHGAVIESATKGQGIAYCWRPLCRTAVLDVPHPDTRRGPQLVAAGIGANWTANGK